MKNPIILSLGGSLVVPDGVDVEFVRAFRKLIETELTKDRSFIVIIGGGKVCRRYQAAAEELGIVEKEPLDWVGIYATRLNAELVRVALGAKAHSELITDPSTLSGVAAPVAVGAGWKPGHSTDYDAVLMAELTGAKRIVNLSNIDYVYDKDPRAYPEAKKIEKIGWTGFRALLPAEWKPGVNAPFDPVAAKRASELGLEVTIMNGKPLLNLQNYLEGKPFKGTVIR